MPSWLTSVEGGARESVADGRDDALAVAASSADAVTAAVVVAVAVAVIGIVTVFGRDDVSDGVVVRFTCRVAVGGGTTVALAVRVSRQSGVPP
jgi:hypothetical protein